MTGKAEGLLRLANATGFYGWQGVLVTGKGEGKRAPVTGKTEGLLCPANATVSYNLHRPL